MKRMLPRGVKKFIRKEKARLRGQFSNIEEYRRAVEELYNKFSKEK